MSGKSVVLVLAGVAAGVGLTAIPAVRNALPFERSGLAATKPEAVKPESAKPEGKDADLVRITPEQIAAQDIGIGKAMPGELRRQLSVPGTIVPATNRIARVPARVVGTVSEMRRQLGDIVRKGDIVAVLDSREVADAKSEYLTASVNADLQKTIADRAQSLWDKRVSAENVYLQARTTNAEAQLRLDLARQKLSALGLDAKAVAQAAQADRTQGTTSSLRSYELRAPMSGRIVERKVDVGTTVGGTGDPSDLYTVADLSVVWAELAIPTADLDVVREGAAVTLFGTSDAAPKTKSGRIVFVSPVLNADTRSARVIAELPNEEGVWRPGAFVRAQIEVARDKVALMVPRAALQTMNNEPTVFVRVPDGFKRRDVKIGRASEATMEIILGLSSGEEVATENSFLLKAELGKAGAAHDD